LNWRHRSPRDPPGAKPHGNDDHRQDDNICYEQLCNSLGDFLCFTANTQDNSVLMKHAKPKGTPIPGNILQLGRLWHEKSRSFLELLRAIEHVAGIVANL
jgi:hypothetical protein